MIHECIHQARDIVNALFAHAAQAPLSHREEYDQVFSMLCDEASREEYRRQMLFQLLLPVTGPRQSAKSSGCFSAARFLELMLKAQQDPELPVLTGAPDWVRLLNLACTFYLEQYRYEKAVDLGEGDILLDCGACLGDTAIWAARKGARVYSFEADAATLPHLKANIAANGQSERIEVVEYAVGDKPGVTWFSSDTDNPGASRICDKDKGVPVPQVSLDAFCADRGVEPTFIKMDIEGAEAMALRGAEQIIRRYRPKLAISLYHHPDHMWELPLFIKGLVPEYQLYCRKNHPEFEFILYAALPDSSAS